MIYNSIQRKVLMKPWNEITNAFDVKKVFNLMYYLNVCHLDPDPIIPYLYGSGSWVQIQRFWFRSLNNYKHYLSFFVGVDERIILVELESFLSSFQNLGIIVDIGKSCVSKLSEGRLTNSPEFLKNIKYWMLIWRKTILN